MHSNHYPAQVKKTVSSTAPTECLHVLLKKHAIPYPHKTAKYPDRLKFNNH